MSAIKVVTICHGNICRSAMAAVILEKQAGEIGVNISIDSAGVSAEEQGNPMDSRAKNILEQHGFSKSDSQISGHRAKKLSSNAADIYDYFITATLSQMKALENNWGINKDRIFMYRAFENLHENGVPISNEGPEMADPWYGGIEDFEITYQQIAKSANNIVNYLTKCVQ